MAVYIVKRGYNHVLLKRPGGAEWFIDRGQGDEPYLGSMI